MTTAMVAIMSIHAAIATPIIISSYHIFMLLKHIHTPIVDGMDSIRAIALIIAQPLRIQRWIAYTLKEILMHQIDGDCDGCDDVHECCDCDTHNVLLLRVFA